MDRLKTQLDATVFAFDSAMKSILPPIVEEALKLSREYRAKISAQHYFPLEEEQSILSKTREAVEKVAFFARNQKMYTESIELYRNIGNLWPALETAEEGGLVDKIEELRLEGVIFLVRHGNGHDFAKKKFGEDKQILLDLVEKVAKEVDPTAGYGFGIDCGLSDKDVTARIATFANLDDF